MKKRFALAVIAAVAAVLGAVVYGVVEAGGFRAWRCELSGGTAFTDVQSPGSPVKCAKPLADAGGVCASSDACMGRCVFDADTTLLPAPSDGPDLGIYGKGGPMDRQRRLPQALLDAGCRPTEPDARGYSAYDCTNAVMPAATCEEYDIPADCEHVWVLEGHTLKLDRDEECDVVS